MMLVALHRMRMKDCLISISAANQVLELRCNHLGRWYILTSCKFHTTSQVALCTLRILQGTVWLSTSGFGASWGFHFLLNMNEFWFCLPACGTQLFDFRLSSKINRSASRPLPSAVLPLDKLGANSNKYNKSRTKELLGSFAYVAMICIPWLQTSHVAQSQK